MKRAMLMPQPMWVDCASKFQAAYHDDADDEDAALLEEDAKAQHGVFDENLKEGRGQSRGPGVQV